MMKKIGFLNLGFTLIIFCYNNSIQSQTEQDFYTIIDDVSSKRIEQDITTLSNYGTRHTLSDTLSENRGIGAARRWIFNSFQRIASNCKGCIEVSYQKNYVKTDGKKNCKRCMDKQCNCNTKG
jgi:hypothetical protein